MNLRQVEQADSAFHQIAECDLFKSSPVLRSLLVYLWKNRNDQVSEYGIAVEALGRPSDFDPKIDATVRVQIARLRTKLRELDDKGSFDLRLSIPVGTHQIQWSYKSQRPSSMVRLVAPSRRPYLMGMVICGAIALASIGLAIYLTQQNRELKARVLPPAVHVPRFWSTFLGNGKPPVIVVPSPVYFRWPNNIVVRDFAVAEFPAWQQSGVLKELSQKWGPPSLTQVYVSALDMEAGISLQRYLEHQGFSAELTESRNFELDSANRRNTIYLGVPRTTEYLNRIFERTNFYYATLATPVVVRNRNPKSGEPIEYREVDYSADHKIYPELIVLLPTEPDGGHSLILFGFMPMALTSLLQSRAGLQMLDEEWKRAGSPDSWEMVVQAEVSGEVVLKTSPMGIRAIPANFWNGASWSLTNSKKTLDASNVGSTR